MNGVIEYEGIFHPFRYTFLSTAAIRPLASLLQLHILDCCPAGHANRISAEAVFEQHTFISQPVDVRRRSDLRQPASICADCMSSMIIGHDKKDIGRLLLSLALASEYKTRHSDDRYASDSLS